ncbi:MAG: aminopeptidase [Candidatus Eremiobacterota bacterium]
MGVRPDVKVGKWVLSMPVIEVEPGYDRRLVPGARNAIEVCLQVRPDQRVFILADRAAASIGRALADAVARVGAPCHLEFLEDHVDRPATSLPDSLMGRLDAVEVALYCVQPLPGELSHRQQFVGSIERRGIRYAHMVGITEAIMCQGMRADFLKVDEISRRLLERARRARSIEVRSRFGTELTVTFSPDRTWRKTSGIIEEVWSNLPGGEIFTAPLSVDGIFVVDGTVGDHFGPRYGLINHTPMVLHIEQGYLVACTCANKDLEREFWSYCQTEPGSDRVGEFAIGTNLAVFEFTGNLLQDEKMPGVHIAFGDPYGSQTGADWRCGTHVDVITGSCDIWIDGVQVMESGIFRADELGFDYTYLTEDPSVGDE